MASDLKVAELMAAYDTLAPADQHLTLDLIRHMENAPAFFAEYKARVELNNGPLEPDDLRIFIADWKEKRGAFR